MLGVSQMKQLRVFTLCSVTCLFGRLEGRSVSSLRLIKSRSSGC